jgi:hypothetical protein
MASWKEERDRLVAQTLAFVQQVAAAHPAAASKFGLASSRTFATSEADYLSPAPDIVEMHQATGEPIADIAPVGIETGIPMPADIAADLPKRSPRYSAASERSDIAQRVATFKARQMTLNREREAYYDSVQARIRTSLMNDTGSDRR